jgi:hypothetical protein
VFGARGLFLLASHRFHPNPFRLHCPPCLQSAVVVAQAVAADPITEDGAETAAGGHRRNGLLLPEAANKTGSHQQQANGTSIPADNRPAWRGGRRGRRRATSTGDGEEAASATAKANKKRRPITRGRSIRRRRRLQCLNGFDWE